MSRAGIPVLKPVSARLEKARVLMYSPLEDPMAAPAIMARIGINDGDRFNVIWVPVATSCASISPDRPGTQSSNDGPLSRRLNFDVVCSK